MADDGTPWPPYRTAHDLLDEHGNISLMLVLGGEIAKAGCARPATLARLLRSVADELDLVELVTAGQPDAEQ